MQSQQPNNWLNFERGELFKKVQQHMWDVDLSFVAEQEDFRDVEVVTLQQYLYDLATDEAHAARVDLEQIDSYIDNLLVNRYHSAREFVSVSNNKITVGVNCDKVDDRALDYATTLLIQMDSLEPGAKRHFSQEITIYGDPTVNKQISETSSRTEYD